MARETNEDRIIELLRLRPELDDDEIMRSTGVKPRQQVNQICRRLERDGVLTRTVGPRGKLVNALTDALPLRARKAVPAYEGDSAFGPATAVPADSEPWCLPALGDLTDTLLLVPCSKPKEGRAGPQAVSPRIGDHLPVPLEKQLDRARAVNRQRACVDERILVPAWQRYSGRFYQAARSATAEAVRRRLHLLILSGGYGVLLARERIGHYEAVLKTSWWPERVLECVLVAYARRHRLKRVRAFVSRTTKYRKVVAQTDWKAAGVEDAVLLMPAGGSRYSVPITQGEAFAALIGRTTLDQKWRSSVGLQLICHRLV